MTHGYFDVEDIEQWRQRVKKMRMTLFRSSEFVQPKLLNLQLKNQYTHTKREEAR